ncbi:MAG TPA: TIGR04282 family arsenosugar biosynthesis glycosyltransferase [Nakamurella sp.]|nr:TIGR04282 family arsenosugar biosynthesis glycosyltransferase [Nakamurella sp.]
MNQQPTVLVMARAPRPGAVKTRLQPLLGAQGCARLQAGLIDRTVRLAERVAPGRCWLALDRPSDLPATARVLRQRGGDLGARMCDAVEQVCSEQPGPVLVIGTDVPTLQARHLRAAAGMLAGGVEVVFGPALDGGYYLIGLRRPYAAVFTIDPALWGGPQVLTASLAAAEAIGLRTGRLEPLRDLDTPQDAHALLAGGSLPEELVRLLRPTAVPS